MFSCEKCPNRETCQELCQAAENYVNQDYVKKKFLTVSEFGMDIDNIVPIDFPAGEIELNTKDWIYFTRKYEMTKTQKRYLFLYYWRHLVTLGLNRCSRQESLSEKPSLSFQALHRI